MRTGEGVSYEFRFAELNFGCIAFGVVTRKA